MTATAFDLIVFDFDDTLVQSAVVKRRSFFEVFPKALSPIVEDVLTADPDGSRHVVIPAMLERASAQALDIDGLTADALVQAYADRVTVGVRNADQVPGAAGALRWAAQTAAAHIFSMTPHDELLAQIAARGWDRVIPEAFGFPNRKPEVLKMLMGRYGCGPDRTIVVGDGVSDADAAKSAGCHYLRADPSWPEVLMTIKGGGND